MSHPNPQFDPKDVLDIPLVQTLFEFTKKHHQYCEDCEGTGKIYNNADPTSGQWVECPYLQAIYQFEK